MISCIPVAELLDNSSPELIEKYKSILKTDKDDKYVLLNILLKDAINGNNNS